MGRNALFGALISGLSFFSAVSLGHAAAVYNAVDDFSGTNGGSSVWSYGYTVSNPGAAPTKLDTYLPGIFGGQVNAWHNSDGSCCNGATNNNSILIGKNVTSGDAAYETIVQPNSYLSEDPESYTSADLVFTAKQAGTYRVNFGFLGIDTGEHAHGVDVLQNGSLVTFNGVPQAGAINSFGAQYASSFTVTLAANDTLDFQTLGGPDFYNLSTGVQATISAVPLPSSAPLFGAALLSLGAAGYRLKRKASTAV